MEGRRVQANNTSLSCLRKRDLTYQPIYISERSDSSFFLAAVVTRVTVNKVVTVVTVGTVVTLLTVLTNKQFSQNTCLKKNLFFSFLFTIFTQKRDSKIYDKRNVMKK